MKSQSDLCVLQVSSSGLLNLTTMVWSCRSALRSGLWCTVWEEKAAPCKRGIEQGGLRILAAALPQQKSGVSSLWGWKLSWWSPRADIQTHMPGSSYLAPWPLPRQAVQQQCPWASSSGLQGPPGLVQEKWVPLSPPLCPEPHVSVWFMWLGILAHVYSVESLMVPLFALVLALAHRSCLWQLCWWWFYLGSSRQVVRKRWCAELMQLIGLPSPGQAVSTHAALLNGKTQRQESVWMGPELNRLEMFGALLQGLKIGTNLSPPSLGGIRMFPSDSGNCNSSWSKVKAEGGESSSVDDGGYNHCSAKSGLEVKRMFCKWERKKQRHLPEAHSHQFGFILWPLKQGHSRRKSWILHNPLRIGDFHWSWQEFSISQWVEEISVWEWLTQAAEYTSWSNMWLLNTPPQHSKFVHFHVPLRCLTRLCRQLVCWIRILRFQARNMCSFELNSDASNGWLSFPSPGRLAGQLTGNLMLCCPRELPSFTWRWVWFKALGHPEWHGCSASPRST